MGFLKKKNKKTIHIMYTHTHTQWKALVELTQVVYANQK